ncbi:terminase TerL endonuclease subunit [Paenibacillus sp. RUD330]|uniref:terminase large subunit n=1 Tax=Paenibacillus sp. RUD330 TaxID=2023772 RepID=UPI000B926567|nr:terminase TerL endonuclease subunit [Paenibacillus sp. RUD330]
MYNVLAQLDDVTQYAADVREGRIVAGKYVRLACERHLKDLGRQGTEDFPYTFEPTRAERVFYFASFCCHVEDGLTVKAGDPVTLDPFLKFIVGSIFGWVHRETGLRRFRKAYEQVARKNSKSTTLSIVGLYMLAGDKEGGPQVYTAATDRQQARIVYGAAEQMAEKSKSLRKRIKFTKSKSLMVHKKSNGRMQPLSKETKKFDGFNPHCGIIDEYHAHPTSDMYDVIVSGMGMRRQPLLFIITTAGFDLNAPCYKEYQYCCKLLEGEVVNEEYFAYIAQMDKDDDIKDDRNWIKCNPLLASSESGIAFLRSELSIAMDSPDKQRGVFTKNFNMWLNAREDGYMRMDLWAACGKEPMPDLTGRSCRVGLDLAKKIDLTSVGFEFDLDDGRVAVLSHSFIPESKLADRKQKDDVDYDLWVRQGYLTVTPGNVVDYRLVQEYVYEQERENRWIISEVCYDDWSAGLISQEMKDRDYEMVEVPQRMNHLSEPTKNFRELVYQGRVIHGNNPVLDWAMGNAVTREDHHENIMLDKKKSKNRIDPVAALITAHSLYVNQESNDSVYRFRGLITT